MLALIHLVAASFLFDFAHAFHIPEHSRITVRAVKDLEICGLLPTSWNQVWTEAIVRADENEDYNLFRKWSKYSHYFNPNHTVRQLRADSSLSVMESVQEIQKNSADSLLVSELIGRIIHHVQDSSVPSHVVPVVHASADGFEVFEIDQVYREPISASECISLSAQEPMEVLRSNALSTLSALQEQVFFQRESFKRQGTWLGTFWLAGDSDNFGSYGPMGNNFGKPVFELEDGRTIRMSVEFYEKFKRDRIKAAVQATRSVILWANRIRAQ
mgnify:CR=1 FL=1